MIITSLLVNVIESHGANLKDAEIDSILTEIEGADEAIAAAIRSKLSEWQNSAIQISVTQT